MASHLHWSSSIRPNIVWHDASAHFQVITAMDAAVNAVDNGEVRKLKPIFVSLCVRASCSCVRLSVTVCDASAFCVAAMCVAFSWINHFSPERGETKRCSNNGVQSISRKLRCAQLKAVNATLQQQQQKNHSSLSSSIMHELSTRAK